MVHGRFVLKFAAFAIAFLLIGTSAWADIVPVTVTGTVYRVWGNLGNAPTAVPSGSNSTLNAPGLDQTEMTFHASQVDFSVYGSGTLQDFLSSGGATLESNNVGANQVMSNCSGSSFDPGHNCYSTVIELTGTYNFLAGTTYTINHDDGAILFAGGGSTNVLPAGSEVPTVDIPSSWTPSVNTSGSFTIWYMATNGNPEVLQLSAVPDGGTTLILLSGVLFGLETLRRKFRA